MHFTIALLCDFIICMYIFLYIIVQIQNNMKEAPNFDFIQNSPPLFGQQIRSQDYYEEEKKACFPQEFMDKEVEQQSLLRTPKSKRGRKFSLKNNPQESSASKISKIKQRKYKNMSADKQKNPNQLFGHWSIQQNKRYHWFLQIYHSHFMNRSLRRMDRIFTSMAKFVGTREAQQCRSHHQKMQKKHKTFPKILLSLRINHYENHSNRVLKQDIQKNEVSIIQPLLSQQFLIENLTLKETLGKYQNNRQERKSQNGQKFQSQEDKQFQLIEADQAKMIEDVIGPQFESSKNYFKLIAPNQQRNDILDDGYESNLPFYGLF